MVKSYLRYELRETWGIVAAASGNAVLDRTGQLALAPALDEVVVWHLKQGFQTEKILHY